MMHRKSILVAVATTSLSLVSTVFGTTMTGAESRLGSLSPQTVRGKVSAVEGEFHMQKNSRGEDILEIVDKSYIVTTPAGQEIHLKLTRETKVPTRANLGDRIEATISGKGQILSVMRIE